MSDPKEPRKYEYSSTYFVSDRNSQDERQRLTLQDQMITTGMGGVLPEQTNSAQLQRVLDIACGPGGWVIEAAKQYPDISLVGIDISKPMVEYARAQAQAHQVADRVDFHVMDATLILELPPTSFDLVNLRFGVSFLRTWEWSKIFSEMQRVARSQGIIRITEAEMIRPNAGPALRQILNAFQRTFFLAGNYFADEGDGITAHLPALFTQYGIQNVQTKAHTVLLRAGTPEGDISIRNMQYLFQTGRPFLQRRGALPKDYDALCNRANAEMQQADFAATWHILTVWGNKPKDHNAQKSLD